MSETSKETLIFTCAGAAHCGQVANRTALQLTADGAGKIFCLAAVSAGIPEKVKRTREAGMRVAIDGCSDHCVRLSLEKAGMPVDLHFVVTECGIEKQPAHPDPRIDAQKLAEHIRTAMN